MRPVNRVDRGKLARIAWEVNPVEHLIFTYFVSARYHWAFTIVLFYMHEGLAMGPGMR